MNPWQTKWLKLRSTHPDIENIAKHVQEFCFGWFKHAGKQTLVLCGPPGTGKTHCARRAIQWAQYTGFSAMEAGNWREFPTVQYARWPEVCSMLEANQAGVMDDLIGCSLVALDDIGAESDRFRSGLSLDRLTQVLTRRCDARIYTLITTNIMPIDWEGKFGARVADRLLRGSTVCDLSNVPSFSLATV